MQVGLNNTPTLGHQSARSPTQVATTRQNRVDTAPAKTDRSDYPASPLISTRPQRYSVQLNDQLTTQQQADSWLSQVEQTLLDYRYANRRGGDNQATARHAQTLQNLLDGRERLSGGAVNRQLEATPEDHARVNFHAPALAAVMDSPGQESLLFSLQEGRHTRLSALSLPANGDPRADRTAFSNALRRLGINSSHEQGQTRFSCREQQWPAIQRTLTVTGEGRHFAAGQVTRIDSTAEMSLSEQLQNALQTGGQSGQKTLQKALDQIGVERQKLARQQDKAHQLINGMAKFSLSQNAVQASGALADSLEAASHNYERLAEAVKGQGRFTAPIVQNLLR